MCYGILRSQESGRQIFRFLGTGEAVGVFMIVSDLLLRVDCVGADWIERTWRGTSEFRSGRIIVRFR
ncbi:hypothetical protein Pan153_21140 [Gimesia panareensis]|uniref:Uncharacterized protein n=1 Tax=Gimesia panareensis TaxID=2527978 RepID=A0A518FM78_9PLAN|nr:hypothetical protein Pan110_16220 [Gimesia panareensis]QDV17461.1 hypothetical protein Pan153_21140 [Gimesia panareensis]